MVKKLTHAEFSRALATNSMAPKQLAEYVMFDPTSAVPKLVFRANVLSDISPSDYNVDLQFCWYARMDNDKRFAERTAKKWVLIEGDSWFNLPTSLGYLAIGNAIKENNNIVPNIIACWGDTLQEILTKKQQDEMDTELEKRPDYFMFTAGGNDMQKGLKAGTHVHRYDEDPTRLPENYLTAEGKCELERIEAGYRSVFDKVTKRYPRLPILCHGYGDPRPLQVKDGKDVVGQYIGQFLNEQGMPPHLWNPIMSAIVDKLDAVIQRVAGSYQGKVRYVNLRDTAGSFPEWPDDMHPDKDGFRILAHEFEKRMP